MQIFFLCGCLLWPFTATFLFSYSFTTEQKKYHLQWNNKWLLSQFIEKVFKITKISEHSGVVLLLLFLSTLKQNKKFLHKITRLLTIFINFRHEILLWKWVFHLMWLFEVYYTESFFPTSWVIATTDCITIKPEMPQ